MMIIACKQEILAAAAALFGQNYRQQRQAVPALPDRMTDTNLMASKLAKLLQVSSGVATVENGRFWLAGW